jgi:hypothetical protein
MNLGIEYIVRTGTVKDVLKPPYSLFLANPNKKKVVVTIYQRDDDLIGKYWDITNCSSQQGLPPMQGFIVNDLTGVRKQLRDHKLLAFKEHSIANIWNSWRYPMPDYIYHSCLDGFVSSYHHKRNRTLWLWQAFLSVYGLVFEDEDDEFLSKYSIMQYHVNRLKRKRSRYWRYWCLWRKHLLLSAGELVFTLPP